MLNGYKMNPWSNDRHLYVPSTKHFSLLLNYDIPMTISSSLLTLGTLITGIALACNGIVLIGLLVVAFGIAFPLSVMFGYKGCLSLKAQQYRYWLSVEEAYARMSKANRKKHKATLTKAFRDDSVACLAKEIFEELKVSDDLSSLEFELESLREFKRLIKEG